MVAEACYLFKWTPDVVLNMPATRFFTLLKHGRNQRLFEKLEQCDFSIMPAMNFKYYETVRGRYARIINRVPEVTERPKIGLDPFDAKDALLSVFATQKRALGYV